MKHIYTLLFLLLTACAANAHNNTSTAAKICDIADSLYHKHQYSEALNYYIKAMKYADEEKDVNTYMACTGYIANIYTHFGDKYSGVSFLEKGYETAVNNKSNDMQSCFLINLVASYCRLNDTEKAKFYFKLLEKTPKSTDKVNWHYYIMYNDANIKNAENKLEEALQKHKETLAYAKKHKMGAEKEMFQENEIALIYLKLKDYDNSYKWGMLCRDRAIKEKNPSLLINAYMVLSKTYKGLGDKENEKKYFTLYSYVEDSLYDIDRFCSTKQELDVYEKEHEKVEYDHKLKTVLTTTVIITIFVIAIFVILFIKHNNKKKVTKDEEDNTVSQKKAKGSETLNIDEEQIEEIYRRIDKVLNDKEQIFNPDFSLNVLAEKIQSNTNYVSWVINNKYQKNFSTLLNEYRIEEACKMLSDENIFKNYTIQSIYEEIGYKNATSFIRSFKKLKGVTPLEYRNRSKGENK